jgi:phosphoserine phosphatase
MKPTCSYPCYRKNKEPFRSPSEKGKTIKLVFFDMDGVLIDVLSSWRYIHQRFGTSNRQSVTAYLNGEIDYAEFMRRDVALWKENGESAMKETIAKILYTLPMMKGARPCFQYLKKHHVKTAIVTAGLDILAEKVAGELGIDYVFANSVTTDTHGRLTSEGILRVELTHKDENVRALRKQLAFPAEVCAAVGNSCFDIPMFETCGLGVAFNPEDDCVRASADVIVEGKDLSNLIPVLEPFLADST